MLSLLALQAGTRIKATPSSRAFLFLGTAGEGGQRRTQSRCQTLSNVPLSWEQALVWQLFETQRLAGEKRQETAAQGPAGGGLTQPLQGSACLLRLEFSSEFESAAARQLPRAKPQKQKHVHMASLGARGETLILSCCLLAEPLRRPAWHSADAPRAGSSGCQRRRDPHALSAW